MSNTRIGKSKPNGPDINEISTHTSGCGPGIEKCNRLQYGVGNGDATSDFHVRITIPPDYKANDTATLQLGGGRHSDDCSSVAGYKGYLGINGGKTGIGIEYNTCDKKKYLDFKDTKVTENVNLRPGSTYNLRGTKENLPDGTVRVTLYLEGKQVAQVVDHGQLGNGTPFVDRQGDKSPIDQLRIDNWTEKKGTVSKYTGGVSGGPFLG